MPLQRSVFLLVGFLASTLLPSAYAQPDVDMEQHRRFKEFQAFVKKKVGVDAVVSPFGFGTISSNSAITTIGKNAGDEDLKNFGVVIVPKKIGVSIGFIRYEGCTSDTSSNPVERVIKIDGQKIQAHYACMPEKGAAQGYSGVYAPLSQEAIVFIKKRFSTMRYVYVELDDFTVPFNTEGFENAWREADGVAL